MGSLVDVRDVIGKWVFGRIEKIEGKSDRKETELHASYNCPSCAHFISKDDAFKICPVCKTIIPENSLEPVVLEPTASKEQGVRCYITFFGWDAVFQEWVGLDRVAKGGSMIREKWLQEGSTVVFRQTPATAQDKACEEPE